MRTIILLAAATLIGSSIAQAGQSKPSALIGTWAVDTSRLPIPPQARPKSVTITFSQAQAGSLTTRVEVTDAADAKLTAEGTTSLDGTPATVKGNLEADMAATTMPASGVLVMQLARGGTPASTRVYAVTQDGKSMVETMAAFGADGRPILRTNHFARIR